MLITCDIGNSRIKTGLFKKDDLEELLYFNVYDELNNFIKNYSTANIAFSSVVPSISDKLKSEFSSSNIFEVTRNSSLNIKLDYKTPETLGIDRICSAEGSLSLVNKNNLDFNKETLIAVLDFGTATTINLIKYPGIFIGGTISPGINMMIKSLSDYTAQLPKVHINDYDNLIGKSTKQSIASGVVNSTVGLVDQIIANSLISTGCRKIICYVTGGNAESIIPFLKIKHKYEKGLVLQGIKSIYERNKNSP